MKLSNKERESFLDRLGAVTSVRRQSAGMDESKAPPDETVWTDEEIQMAIDMGF